MLRLTLLLVSLAALVEFNPVLALQRDQVHFVHPTFELARGRTLFKQPILTISPGKISVELIDGSGTIRDKVPRPSRLERVDTEGPLGSDKVVAHTWLMNWNEGDNELAALSYDDERKRLHDLIRRNATAYWLGQTKCHEFITLRAFETSRSVRRDDKYTFSSFGHDQGITACYIEYEEFSKDGMFDPSKIRVSVAPLHVPTTRYKIAALWSSRVAAEDELLLYLLDEAGYIYVIRMTSDFKWAKEQSIISLSSLELEPMNPEIGWKYSTPLSSNDTRLLEGEQGPDSDALQNMKAHYSLSFVESILIFRQAICFSRGTGPNPNLTLLNCMGRDSILPRGISGKSQNDFSIRAAEMYTHNGRFYLHMFYAVLDSSGLTPSNSVGYQFYSTDSLEKMALLDFPAQSANQDYGSTRVRSNIMPIDIVYIRECKRLLVLYPHVYTLHKADGPVAPVFNDSIEVPEYKLVDWMNYPINAVLYAHKRLYLFLSGNEVIVSKEMNLNESNCQLDSFQEEARYPASSLLLHAFDDLNGSSHSERPSVYNGKDFWIGSRGWNDNSTKKRVRVSREHAIFTDDDIKTTTTTPKPFDPDKPDGKSGNSLSIIIVIVVVVIVIGIVIGFVYYFCCSSSEEPLRRPKSALRKLKTLGVGGSPSKSGGMATAAPPGSTVTSVPTVRSGLQSSKQGSTTANPAANVTSAAKTVEQPKSSPKSNRSPRSPRSPKSVRSLKSHKSRSPGPPPGSPKSKTKTVGSAGPSGSRKSSPVGTPLASKSSKPLVSKQAPS